MAQLTADQITQDIQRLTSSRLDGTLTWILKLSHQSERLSKTPSPAILMSSSSKQTDAKLGMQNFIAELKDVEQRVRVGDGNDPGHSL